MAAARNRRDPHDGTVIRSVRMKRAVTVHRRSQIVVRATAIFAIAGIMELSYDTIRPMHKQRALSWKYLMFNVHRRSRIIYEEDFPLHFVVR